LIEAPVLTVAEYDAAEQEAVSRLPNRIVEAYQPVTFQEVGYPVRVRRESELWKYVDVMQELRFEEDYAGLVGGLTVNEFELLKKLTELVYRFSESNFQRKLIATASILRMLNILRHIRYLFGDARPRVFEIGPGCGYLGAMLMLEGYPYAATEVAQAFYLYQNHFWNFISDGKVLELARDNASKEQFGAIPPGGAVHIPWWQFVKLEPESVPQFDIITANHCLCEMHPDSLGFALRIAQALLRGNEAPKAFLFEGWGSEIQRTQAYVAERFSRFGFNLVHHDPQITVFAPRGMESAAGHLSLPRRVKGYWVKRWPYLLRYRSFYVPLSANITSYEPCWYTSKRNPLSRTIIQGRHSLQGGKTVTIEQVNSFYTDLLGSDDHMSPDEHFWRFVNRAGS